MYSVRGVKVKKIVLLDCEDCVYYEKTSPMKEPCNNCYGFEYYIDIETGFSADEMRTINEN
jgi:hypothetical protein